MSAGVQYDLDYRCRSGKACKRVLPRNGVIPMPVDDIGELRGPSQQKGFRAWGIEGRRRRAPLGVFLVERGSLVGKGAGTRRCPARRSSMVGTR